MYNSKEHQVEVRFPWCVVLCRSLPIQRNVKLRLYVKHIRFPWCVVLYQFKRGYETHKHPKSLYLDMNDIDLY